MRLSPRRFLFALALLCGPALAAPPAIHAAPADIARAPDVSFQPCATASGESDLCTIRAFGDFNGDRRTDIVIERLFVGTDMRPRDEVALQDRHFELLLSPFTDGKGPAKRVEVQMQHEPDSDVDLTVADIDRDGFDDLALATVFNGLQGPVVMGSRRVAIVKGAQYLTMRYSLGSLDGDANTIAWNVAAESTGDIAKAMLPFVDAAFGDVNGDGFTDMILGTGANPAVTLVARSNHSQTEVPNTRTSVAVMFGTGDWSHVKQFRPNAEVADLGACVEALAGIADLTGDGVDDIVYRRCATAGLPPQLAVLPGTPALVATAVAINARSPWPSIDPIDPIGAIGAIDNYRMPDIVAALNAVATETASDTEVPRPPEPGRGYLPSLPPEEATPLFFEDVDADGIRDIVLGFGENAHVWLGGPDVAARVAAHRTDRVIVGAGFGAMVQTRAWHAADLDGNGDRDMLLVIDQTPRVPGGVAVTEPAHGGQPAPAAPAADPAHHIVQVYKGEHAAVDVLDAELDEPDAVWHSKQSILQGMADFDGDGITDLVFGRAPGAPLQVEISYSPLRER